MLAGCTIAGSKGFIVIRPASISARMSRSESSTGTTYRAAAVGYYRSRRSLRETRRRM